MRIKLLHIVGWLPGSIADLLMSGADKGVSTTNYLWPSKLSYYCSPHTEEARFVVLLLDEGERVREMEYGSVCVCVTYYRVCVCV